MTEQEWLTCGDPRPMLEQVREQVSARKLPIASISTDSWGVDYLLFSDDGSILTPTFHYRDLRTQKGVEQALANDTVAIVDCSVDYSENMKLTRKLEELRSPV